MHALPALKVGARMSLKFMSPCLMQAHIYLCDDAPKGAAAKKGGPTYRDERSRMMGLGSGDAPTSLRSIARGDASSTLHRKVPLLQCCAVSTHAYKQQLGSLVVVYHRATGSEDDAVHMHDPEMVM